MSKELKPYEKENELLRKIREKKGHQHRRKIELDATKRGLERCTRTYNYSVNVYKDEIQSRIDSIETVEGQIAVLGAELKKIFPKPKIIKKAEIKPKNNKVICDICEKEYSKKGIKGHRKACLKKKEYELAKQAYEQLQLEETLEELDKEDPEIKIEETNEGD